MAHATTLSRRISRAPETAKFIRRAAPAFFREIAKEYSRESLPAPHCPHPKQWPDTGLHAAWIGHSTVLLKVDGLTVLTDPVFSSRAGLNFGSVKIGIKRLVDSPLEVRDLPPIDLVLLSHAHMDHFDIPTLRQLEGKRTHLITAHRTCDLVRARRYGSVRELRWGDSAQVGPIHVSAFQVAHWGARMRSDVYRGYNGYVFQIGRYRVLFGGDTAYTDTFRDARAAERIDVAIMPIGAYDPWIRVHCNPEQAVQMANLAGAERIFPVHHQTFQLSREPRLEPIERLYSAVGNSSGRICVSEIGEEFHFQK